MKKFLGVLCVGLLCMAFTGTHAVAGEEERENGLYGHIFLGGAWGTTDSNLSADSDNSTIKSLSSSGKDDDGFGVLAQGTLGYVTESGLDLYLASEGNLIFGTAYDFEEIGLVRLEGFYARDEVWKDPFLTGVKRSKTDKDEIGGVLSVEEIMGTGLNVEYSYTSVDVDQDLIGKNVKSLGRDGNLHAASVSYDFLVGENHGLTPMVSWQKGSMDGKAESFGGWSAGLDYAFMQEHWVASMGFSAGKKEFDAVHPSFGKVRDEVHYEIHGEITLMEPMGFENVFVTAMASYGKTDSNINFYDKTESMAGLGVGYSF